MKMEIELWEACLSELEQNKPCVLATVLEQSGSTPRGPGACMLVRQGGKTLGTIGGGAVEHQAALRCADCLAKGCSALLEYQLSPGDAQNLGMVCGGSVTVHCHYMSPQDAPLTEALKLLNGLIRQGRDSLWLLRGLEANGEVTAIGLYETDRLLFNHGLAPEDIRALCLRRAMLRREPTLLFSQPIRLSGHAYVFGGGHIARELVPLLGRLDFAPVVYDDRAEFADPALFPAADSVILGSFERVGERLTLTEEDCAVIMTRGHAYDHALLTQALKSRAGYIGLIGSRGKIAHTKALLFQEGFSEADFQRVHTPIGLSIGAETPMEIAVSVAAEMILHRAQRNGSRKL